MPPEVFGGESRPSSLLLPCFAACPRRLNIGTDYRGYANGLHTGGVKMPEEVAAEAEHDHGWEIVVNGDPHEVPHSRVSWDEVVDLAYPGERDDPDKLFRVDYEDARSEPTSGPLVEGGHVVVERQGTEFSVIRSVRS